MMILYPELKPYIRHQLAVSDVHELYIEASGNPNGIPVLFVHGGPGGGCDVYSRRYFDPELYHIILFDQRGSGRSLPHACLENNTTQDLVSDMEKIREYFNIDRWLLFGGSWGSTLSLVYAQTHPERVLAMILRGIFLCRLEDINWFYRSGASQVFPDYWRDFVNIIPENERDDLIKAYHKRLNGADDLARMGAAKAWSTWEGRCATLRPNQNTIEHFNKPHRAMALARLETHYFVNNAFLEPNQIINNADQLKDIPGVIVHGRYDMVCPAKNAYDLHKAWPDSELHMVREAGHVATEPGIVDALIRATDDMADHFKSEFL